MKLRSLISVILICTVLLACGCNKNEDSKTVLRGTNLSFTEDMALYMAAYTRMMLEEEMSAAGVDKARPLSEQMRSDGESWEDYLYEKTVENMESILLYSEAAIIDEYAIDEGMVYKATETINYLSNTASEAGLTAEEYITQTFGEGVTVASVETCTQMMTVCEGYEIHLRDSEEVSDEEAAAYADENPNDFLKFDALRFASADKAVAESLAAAKNPEEFLNVISGISGIDLTDTDKNGTPDAVEVNDAVVSADPVGEFAVSEGRTPGDTTVSESNGKYTVTMLLSTPQRDTSPVWDFRLIYISTASSTDPHGDASSLRDQWLEKEGGEKDFANLAARYSDDPTAYYGGRNSGVTKAEMPTNEVAQWVCDSARVTGDTVMIPGGDDGAYLLYYIDGNIPTWQYEVTQTIKSQRTEEKISSMEEEIRKNFSLNEDLMRKIVKGK